MSTKIISSHEADILDQICAVIQEHKREISIHYSEIKLRLPTYLKSVTIGQIREAGGTVNPDITIPRSVKEHLQKSTCINEKFNEVRDCFKEQVREYYNNVKKQLPDELLQKKMSELTQDEWNLIGIDVTRFKQTIE